MLREHVLRGRVNADTVLAVEVEFCTHGFDGVGRCVCVREREREWVGGRERERERER